MAPRKHGEPASWEVDSHLPKPQGEGRARRAWCTKELVMPNVNTVHDLLLYGARVHGSKQAFGTREVLDIITEDRTLTRTDSSTSSRPSLRKPVEVYHLSPLSWMTYEEALQDVRDLGCGLRSLGAGTRADGQYFAIYASTSRNWMFMAQACAFNGVPICTVYDTATPEAIAEAFQEAQVPALFTGADQLSTLSRIVSRTPMVKLIVYDGHPDRLTLARFKSFPHIRLVSINKVRRLGKEHIMPQAERATRDDVYCLMYTSGGAGKPKGVLLTHGNICSAAGSIETIMGDDLVKEEMFLAFLPQAHIFEFVMEMAIIFVGIPIAYGRIKTLTDAGVRDCKSDIMEARPSIMIAVPTVWELMRKGIINKVEEGGTVKRAVFNAALKAKTAALDKHIPGIAGLTDAVVFNRVRQSTGGRLRTLVCGGGALSPETTRFLSAALVRMIHGYGMTEGTAMACLLHPAWNSPGSVGGPMPGVEIKLVDRLELGLSYSTDAPTPQGEVYLRGPAVFKGYFNPTLDAEVSAGDGWLRTGDIGQWNPDGTLTVIDRIKNHIQLAGGKYVKLERLESIYKSSPLVANACVIAHHNHRHPAMVAVVHPAHFVSFARKNGILCEQSDIELLCMNDHLVTLALREINSIGRRSGLKGSELLEALVLTADEWTPESGLLTAAQKLRRPVVEDYYAVAIDRVYTSKVPVYPFKNYMSSPSLDGESLPGTPIFMPSPQLPSHVRLGAA